MTPQNIGIRTEVSLVAKLSFVKTEIIWKRVSEKKGEPEVKELLRGKVSHAVVRVAMVLYTWKEKGLWIAD